jgi:hypothetical protein
MQLGGLLEQHSVDVILASTKQVDGIKTLRRV